MYVGAGAGSERGGGVQGAYEGSRYDRLFWCSMCKSGGLLACMSGRFSIIYHRGEGPRCSYHALLRT